MQRFAPRENDAIVPGIPPEFGIWQDGEDCLIFFVHLTVKINYREHTMGFPCGIIHLISHYLLENEPAKENEACNI